MLGHQPSMCRAGKPPAVHGRQVLSGVLSGVRQNMLPRCITSASFCAALRHICVILPGDTPQCNATANRKGCTHRVVEDPVALQALAVLAVMQVANWLEEHTQPMPPFTGPQYCPAMQHMSPVVAWHRAAAACGREGLE